MARFIVCLPADPRTRYAPDAFATQVGKAITVRHPDGRPATGTLVDAQVGAGGTEALLTVEWEDPLDMPLCVKWEGHDGLRMSCSRCWPWWHDRAEETAPRTQCPDVHAHEGHGWTGGDPWTTRWCTGVQQCPEPEGRSMKVWVVFSDYGLNGPWIHAVRSTQPTETTEQLDVMYGGMCGGYQNTRVEEWEVDGEGPGPVGV